MRFPHLNGRAGKLADSLDLPADLAEWLAVCALHSGCFLRSQLQFFGGCNENNRKTVLRIIRRLINRKLITETPTESIGLLARVTNKSIYRLLDAGDIRHRRKASWPLMYRRLLCLDYVLDHPQLPWLPTENEKVACFDALGIERSKMPYRIWKGAVGQTLRLFGNKHPIAVDVPAQHAVFVYADSDEKSPQGVRSWHKEHTPLLTALHQQGFRLEIVHASFNPRLSESVSRVFTSWQHAPVASPVSSNIKAELQLVQQAIRSNDDSQLAIYGGFNGALRASTVLKKRIAELSESLSFSATYSTWLSKRIAQAVSNPNPYGSRKVHH